MRKIDRLRPAVANSTLILLAGLVWTGVGILLLSYSWSWLSVESQATVYLFSAAGVAAALIIHHFGFLRIADRNLERILRTEDRKCLFAFIPYRSYLTIALMVLMGALLRHSSIPRTYLSVLYTGIGLALVLSSVRYLRIYRKELRK